MYVLIAGGGKVGANVARTLLRSGHEVTLIESGRDRYERLEAEFEHQVQRGDATEISTLEKAGIRRPPDLVLAVTGDDEDNLVICQLAQVKYGVEKVIARVNDPRNQPHFDLLGIAPTVCATSSILGLVEHEVPAHIRRGDLPVHLDTFERCVPLARVRLLGPDRPRDRWIEQCKIGVVSDSDVAFGV